MSEICKKCYSKNLNENKNSDYEFMIFEGFNDKFESFVQPRGIFRTENYERVNNEETHWTKYEFTDNGTNGELYEAEIGDYIVKEYDHSNYHYGDDESKKSDIYFSILTKEEFNDNFYLEDEFIRATDIHNFKTANADCLNKFSRKFINTLTDEQREMFSKLIKLIDECKN